MEEKIVANDNPKPKKKLEYNPEEIAKQVEEMPVSDTLEEKLRQVAIETGMNDQGKLGS